MDAGKKRIWVRGQLIEVTDEVYAAYMKGDRKMRYFEKDLKCERLIYGSNGEIKQVIPSREDSLDRLMEENARQFAANAESVEDVVFRKLTLDKLHTALLQLPKEERALIYALFFDGKTESEVAKHLGVARQAIQKRKNRILKKLKKFFCLLSDECDYIIHTLSSHIMCPCVVRRRLSTGNASFVNIQLNRS